MHEPTRHCHAGAGRARSRRLAPTPEPLARRIRKEARAICRNLVDRSYDIFRQADVDADRPLRFLRQIDQKGDRVAVVSLAMIVSMDEGGGTGWSSWRMPSTWKASASLAMRRASSRLRPAVMQSGKSGKSTP